MPKFYWTVMSAGAIEAGLQGLRPADLLPEWVHTPDGELDFGYPDDRIDAVIEGAEVLPAKVAAMSAHATQVSVGPTGRAFALSNKVALPILASEHYVLAAGVAGERDARGWETDLLAGLDLGAS
ncbi:1D-myo-inositol 2-acetamido-2-deoxy-alpha-D-glucopyranoside deacetylase [Mycobacterium talmoniae]|uniref:1D-myo-inositol 2-acetamido-2-deoxy-alpha-D-glucopyranoside deacetylase n=1 Tax=Mycobacterium talmoniae TaxID=1858794 RepID=A0A2S8BPS2_9MYCO|nr:1D-myo-inositol 2-acetamido-2-deoxy-alpha-D-glucopyranoside deacetylase [Mycobacterium talmoniae]